MRSGLQTTGEKLCEAPLFSKVAGILGKAAVRRATGVCCAVIMAIITVGDAAQRAVYEEHVASSHRGAQGQRVMYYGIGG